MKNILTSNFAAAILIRAGLESSLQLRPGDSAIKGGAGCVASRGDLLDLPETDAGCHPGDDLHRWEGRPD